MKAITAGRTNTVSSYLPAFHCLERSGPRSCEKIRQPPLNQPITQGCKGPQIGTFTWCSVQAKTEQATFPFCARKFLMFCLWWFINCSKLLESMNTHICICSTILRLFSYTSFLYTQRRSQANLHSSPVHQNKRVTRSQGSMGSARQVYIWGDK